MKHQNLISFSIALIFGFGLCISGMIDPKNVIGFLDIFGDWKPALILVMAAGILVAIPFYHLAKKQEKPILGQKFPKIPSKIDAKLVIGAAIFGIGWGIVGICPGPAIVALSFAPIKILVFLVAMYAGSKIADYLTETAIIGPISSPESLRPNSSE